MAGYTTEVAVRWSDMDAFGHVNHARTVTLLEDARTGLLFGLAPRHGADGLAGGVVVARLAVHYQEPLIYSGTPVTVRLWVSEMRAASFTFDYAVHDGRTGAAVTTAQTQLVPYDLAAGRPRRLTGAERAFLDGYRPAAGGGSGG